MLLDGYCIKAREVHKYCYLCELLLVKSININTMKFCVAFIVILKVVDSRFLQYDLSDKVELPTLSIFNFTRDYDQSRPIFNPYFHLNRPYGPIKEHNIYQPRYRPVYSYSNLYYPFNREYRPNWLFRTKHCWPINKVTSTERNIETFTEKSSTTTDSTITIRTSKDSGTTEVVAKETTINVFTSGELTTEKEDEGPQNSTPTVYTTTSKKLEESTTNDIENIIPIDYNDPEAV